jgi:hypothetical protein
VSKELDLDGTLSVPRQANGKKDIIQALEAQADEM